MTHKSLVECCELLGLSVSELPDSGRKTFTATRSRFHSALRVYWSTSTEGGMLGLPRIIVAGRDTHACNLNEVKYLVSLQP